MDIYKNMSKKDLSPYACKDTDAIRFTEEQEDFRPPFFHDIDRILYSYSYLRYMDKTQVFPTKKSDHITRRMYHVQMVSKIARTIGRALSLNEDLIEAASLAHDLGHVPFGHFGEQILNEISLKNNEGYFNHNIESVRLLMNLEKKGEGLNLTLQVLDAVMTHNGEFVLDEYYPVKKSKEQFLEEYENSYHDQESIKKLRPMTLEGCVVRISDMIAYLGKDIDDACSLKVFDKSKIPENIKKNLGIHNKDIINTIVCDIIKNSLDKPYIKLSPNIYQAIKELKDFNNKNIYQKSLTKKEQLAIKDAFYTVYNYYLQALENNNQNTLIHTIFLNYKSKFYNQKTTSARKVLDFIAGMTDDFLMKTNKKIKMLNKSHNKKEVTKNYEV